MNEKIEAAFRLFVFLAFFAMIGIFIYLVLNDLPGRWVTLFASALLLVAARLKDIVRLKLTKDGLETELEKVRESVNELHAIAQLFGRISLQTIHGAGRWGGFSGAAKEEMRQSIIDGLKAIKLPNQDLEKVLAVERPFFSFDYYAQARSAANAIRGAETNEAWTEAFKPFVTAGVGGQPAPEVLEGILRQFNLLRGEVIEAMEDYRQYYETGIHRRQLPFRRRLAAPD